CAAAATTTATMSMRMRPGLAPASWTSREAAHEPSGGPAGPDSAARRGVVIVHRAPPLRAEGAAQRGVAEHGRTGGGGGAAVRTDQPGPDLGLPAGRLAGAAGHRAGRRRASRLDAAHHPAAGHRLPAVRLHRLGPARTPLPCAVPV